MKKPRKGKGAGTSGTRTSHRTLVLVDQEPLRRKAASECGRQMARLEKAKAEWKYFQHEDEAPYACWRAVTFGPLLSRLRELQAAIRLREAMVGEIEFELLFGGASSHRAAYRRVEERHNNPPPEPEPEPEPVRPGPEANGPGEPGGEGAPPSFEELPEFVQEMLFEEYLATEKGMNPDRMSDRQYAKLFAEFKAGFAKAEPAESPEPPVTEPPKPVQNRVKELYRLLVRRLHPDMRADGDPEVSAIWHEVQEAYRDGNVERLETLLALSDLEANVIGEQTSLAQMRAMLAELRSSYQALQRNLAAARKSPAWNFGRLRDRSALEARLGGMLKTTIATHERQLVALEAQLAKWAQPPKSRKKSGRGRQMDFFM